MMSPSQGTRDNGTEGLWLDDDVSAVDSAKLASLGFFTAALRRSAWFWRVAAVVGLLVGSGLYLKYSHTYHASTTLLLTVGPEAEPDTAILDDQAIAQSHAVAGLTLHKLGLQESVSSFLGSYTATPLTDRVLQITASAPSSDEAVRRASALATEFLTFRASELEAQQQLELTALDQQVTQARQNVTSISKQIGQLSARHASPSRQARLRALREQGTTASNDLTVLEQQVSATKAATRVTTATMIGGSNVLDPASPVPPRSRLGQVLLYAGGGLIVGLVVGMGIVLVRALLSDRLRRRDDVAQALGAPVKLSVPALRARGRLPGRRGRDPDRYLRRIVSHLGDAVPAGSRRAAALAVVPVGDPRVAALSVASLARSLAQQGRDVVVADLCSGAPAARLLGAKGPGVHRVSVDRPHLLAAVPDAPVAAVPDAPVAAVPDAPVPDAPVAAVPDADLVAAVPDADLVAAVPDADLVAAVPDAHLVAAVPDPTESVPAGPLRPISPGAQTAIAGELAAVCASADVLLTLITLDPSVGSEHLATWAADAVVVVTAGRSSWTKIQAVGEMIRLAGARLVSAVLVGADKTDESLGVTLTPEAVRVAVAALGKQADAAGPFAGGPVERPCDDGAVSIVRADPPESVGNVRNTGP
jgi:capsular polysaccharide biosynthesis protein